jgi:hypothetical protein
LLIFEDWVIIILVPPCDPDHFGVDVVLIRDLLEHQRYAVKTISRSIMGAALVQFNNTCARDTAIRNRPYFVGESIIGVIP